MAILFNASAKILGHGWHPSCLCASWGGPRGHGPGPRPPRSLCRLSCSILAKSCYAVCVGHQEVALTSGMCKPETQSWCDSWGTSGNLRSCVLHADSQHSLRMGTGVCPHHSEDHSVREKQSEAREVSGPSPHTGGAPLSTCRPAHHFPRAQKASVIDGGQVRGTGEAGPLRPCSRTLTSTPHSS